MYQLLVSLVVAVCSTAVFNPDGLDDFENVYLPQVDSLMDRDLSALGEIHCSLSSDGNEAYSITTTFGDEYAISKMRSGGAGWDSIRTPDYYAAVTVDPEKPGEHAVMTLIKKSDDSWDRNIERRKLPLFSMLVTPTSSLADFARSDDVTVTHESLENGDRYIITASEESDGPYQYVLEFVPDHQFPVVSTVYFENSKSSGSTKKATAFKEIDGVEYPTTIEISRFSEGQTAEMTIKTTIDQSKALDIELCSLEAYKVATPDFEVANAKESSLTTILSIALGLILISGCVWFFFRK